MERARKSAIVWLLVAAVIGFSIPGLVILRVFFFDYSRVPQDGMYPGIPAGGWFVSKRSPYGNVNDVKRGDVVIFTRDLNGRPAEFIWRVIGLPGDRVEISADSVFINGSALKHEPIRRDRDFLIVREWQGETSYEVAYDQSVDESQRSSASLIIPANHLFVLGDNRYRAQDSIYIGPIPFESITEKRIL